MLQVSDCTYTDERLLSIDSELRAQADDLLDRRGLRNLLQPFGQFRVVGSYSLHLMTWRDLDIALNAPAMEVESVLRIWDGAP